jgi:hypothetical protein
VLALPVAQQVETLQWYSQSLFGAGLNQRRARACTCSVAITSSGLIAVILPMSLIDRFSDAQCGRPRAHKPNPIQSNPIQSNPIQSQLCFALLSTRTSQAGYAPVSSASLPALTGRVSTLLACAYPRPLGMRIPWDLFHALQCRRHCTALHCPAVHCSTRQVRATAGSVGQRDRIARCNAVESACVRATPHDRAAWDAMAQCPA